MTGTDHNTLAYRSFSQVITTYYGIHKTILIILLFPHPETVSRLLSYQKECYIEISIVPFWLTILFGIQILVTILWNVYFLLNCHFENHMRTKVLYT